MGLEIKDNDFIVSVFVAERPEVNFLLMLSYDDVNYKIQYRFRYFEDNKTFNSKDRKSFWYATVPRGEMSVDDMLKKIKNVMKMMCIAGGFSKDYSHIKVNGDSKVWFHRMGQFPHLFHMRVATKEEVEEMKRKGEL